MDRTQAEQTRINNILEDLARLRKALDQAPLDAAQVTAEQLYSFLALLKAIQGNASNSMSFVAKLLAKSYLLRVLPVSKFDAAWKAEGAPGLDIEVTTEDGKRVVAEVKTTYPYKDSDLGSKQKEEFDKDFAKLNGAAADYKFFFVTELQTFQVMKRKYAARIPGVKVVLLPSAEEYLFPAANRTTLPEIPDCTSR